MTRKEMQEIAQQMLDVYSGILFHNQEFESGNAQEIIYEFDCPEFEELRNKYDLVKVAGKGSDFMRAKRLLHYLAPRLTHSSWYDNHIECNALRLLEYSLNNPEQGINCLNKSKILVECCMALGIFARRVIIMPFSPYDFDNHVVAEIYDKTLQKWIMLDPTTDGYFIDDTKTPLSLLEMRSKFANAEFITFVLSTDSLRDIQKLRAKHLDTNMYICKNLFYFQVEQYSTFGEKDNFLQIIPLHYSVKKIKQANLKYRIDNLPAEYEDFRKKLEESVPRLEQFQEPQRTNVESMRKKPI
ncbi:MAG: transglutaminase domain-containing protein [Clostridia bacterium]|nr:transglutaminase domain-containing protein [Clostridia bacterium]